MQMHGRPGFSDSQMRLGAVTRRMYYNVYMYDFNSLMWYKQFIADQTNLSDSDLSSVTLDSNGLDLHSPASEFFNVVLAQSSEAECTSEVHSCPPDGTA